MSLELSRILASDNLPTLPAVAIQVLKIARWPVPDIKELARVIKSDPALAAKVLRTANSSLFGVRRQVTAIEQAVPLLGSMTVSSVVLSFSIAASAVEPGPLADRYHRIWKSSLTQAVAADSLSRVARHGMPAEFFAAGLLQDIGVLALLRAAPTDYQPVLAEYDERPDATLVEIERARLGLAHPDVSVALCQRWGLPETVSAAIAAHHDGPNVHRPTECAVPAVLVHALATAAAIGDYFCRATKQHGRSLVEELSARHYNLAGDALHAFLEDTCSRVRDAADLFCFDAGACPSYEEILAQANAELADIALRAQLASMQAGAQVEAAQRELTKLADQTAFYRTQAYQDPLTGAYNRGFFEESLEREHARCVRYGGSLGLIFLDLDHFKRLNDNYGHLFGDEVLKRTVQSVQGAVRETDLVARFGGEEFVVLVIELKQCDLIATAERIRKAIESLALCCGEDAVNVTASVGATYFSAQPGSSATHASLVETADGAMYDAKRSGRNQVRFRACLSRVAG